MLVVIVVVIHVMVVAATPLRFFKFFATLARLSAFLAVTLHRVAQLILSLVNTLFTSFVFLVSRVVRVGALAQERGALQALASGSRGRR